MLNFGRLQSGSSAGAAAHHEDELGADRALFRSNAVRLFRDIIRRHRLAERLFTDSLALDSESEIEQQACKFEHILSPEATDKICAFLGHPRTCPHGAPIPLGPCCDRQIETQEQQKELRQASPLKVK